MALRPAPRRVNPSPLIAVCKPCHLVTHFGLANIAGRTGEAFTHLRATGLRFPR